MCRWGNTDGKGENVCRGRVTILQMLCPTLSHATKRKVPTKKRKEELVLRREDARGPFPEKH
jgi:hypothetical protein